MKQEVYRLDTAKLERWSFGYCVTLTFSPPRPWPRIFKVKFRNSCSSGIVVLIGVKRKRSGSIRYWAGYMILPFSPWPWHWKLRVKGWHNFISGMGGLIDTQGMRVDYSWPWHWPFYDHGRLGGCDGVTSLSVGVPATCQVIMQLWISAMPPHYVALISVNVLSIIVVNLDINKSGYP